ncbi:MAG: hypothetical protein B6242_07760 [Anaerolineaceae bacterium 4572_78]|nr:MAG: hypothetical protein B6242_07760 [Anaerolineaceae bacterium 4572_78]
MRHMLISLFSHIAHHLFPVRTLPQHPKKIIVIKPCCLGDVVLATPAIAALHARYPQAMIDVAVGTWSRSVLENNPHINHLIDSGRVGQGHYSLHDVWRFAQRVRNGNYDLAVTLDRSPLVGMVAWLAGIRHRLGMDSGKRGFAHTVRVHVPQAVRHEAMLYLDCVAMTGIKTTTNHVSNFWTEFHPSWSNKALPSSSYVVIHPSGGVNPGMTMLDKRWTSVRFAKLASRFNQAGFSVIFSGTKDDIPLCKEIINLMTTDDIYILAGKLTLEQFGALCQQATLFIGGDTGAMHIAVATGCKTLAIFGPTDPKRYGPFALSHQAIALWRPIPLPSGGVGQGHANNFSWEDGVTVDEVWRGVEELVSGEHLQFTPT